ncbi:MAG: GGDEF domain-containing protein [gamma proteobacterium symbiont of Bathyaustriella thionipta]|nr:GGDEF domain-containing protein [gamma proteobacterium symbiont of Bathyaustriella thionipta]MCU7951024.1 GGDEF domain-containing protein [gamma proteobacterium symbiont of Bathyaustriella thionipta]MCU7953983.1 GGDEF domain-containing protein [gamma proteobacterium symbiont of Bathyaustriella thionipta]MCU7957534.1 GGDEF domain-containing protein [gamma proteobacterium symbiont of Bathyaustriella thionipta]MCU7968620.1 GGDEF domain-containing protein [gamma proteobacterium symbiont of Bathy
MNKRLTKYHIPLLLSLLFVLFLLSGNYYIYQQQSRSLNHTFNHSQETELKLLAHLAKESLILENYALLEWFFTRWGEEQHHITCISLKNKTGFAIVDYQRPGAYEAEIIANSRTIILNNDRYSLTLESEALVIKEQLESLIVQLALVSSIATALLGALIWVLFQRLAIQPLVHEIYLRHKAEQQLHENQQYLEHIAHHDSLTGLPNRLLFNDRLEQAVLKSKRTGKSFALFFIDLDQFKQINDTAGHAAGDKVMIHTTENLKNCIRADDTIARIGGDEFTIILSSFKNSDDITGVAEKIIKAVQKPITIDSETYQLTVSVGISIYPEDADNIRVLMQYADIAMYKVKQQGRNAYLFYT